MTTPADPPTRWDADPSSRAATRALLMSLARERDWYFVLPPASNALLGVLTFGLVPLLRLTRRADRWRRLTWTQRAELGRWIAAHRDPLVGQRLAADADRVATPLASGHAIAWLAGVVALSAGVVALHTDTWWVSPVALLWPTTPTIRVPLTLAHTAVAFAWTLRSARAKELIEPPDPWLDALNRWLERDGRRPVTLSAAPRRVRWPWSAAVFASPVAAVTGSPVWMLAIVATLYAWNHHVRASRVVRLQLIERVLEGMDDGELPVEYDVVALKPDEIAAMIA